MATYSTILHLLAWNGYEDEAYKGSTVCKETWEDERILFPRFINKRLGAQEATLIGLHAYYTKNPVASLERIKRLVSLRADINAPNEKNGFTPLMELCALRPSSKTLLFQYLIDQGAQLEPIQACWCPLSLLSINMSPLSDLTNIQKKMEILLDRGARVNYQNLQGDSILSMACRYSISVSDHIRFLCERGADVHLKNSEGKTALSYCLDLGKISYASILVDYGAIIPPNAMITALEQRSDSVVNFLKKHGYTISNDELVDAMNNRCPDKVYFLLSHGVSIDIRPFGKPILFHAVASPIRRSTPRIVEYICKAGAKVNDTATVVTRNAFMEEHTMEEPVLYDLIRQYIHSENEYILDTIEILVQCGATPPPATEYSHIYPFYKDPFKFTHMNTILLRGRMKM
jgi:hypothetical protein